MSFVIYMRLNDDEITTRTHISAAATFHDLALPPQLLLRAAAAAARPTSLGPQPLRIFNLLTSNIVGIQC